MAYYYNSFQPYLQDYHYAASYNTAENAAEAGNYGYGNYEYAMPQSSMTDYNYNYYNLDNQYSISQYQQPAYEYYAAGSDFTAAYSYSVSTYSHPNLIEFDPSASAYSSIYSPAQTQCVISYSVSEFNEPEFEEYDPTPYGGGYDITQTYGKPLPPSEKICHPRSNIDPNAQILDGLSLESAKQPDGAEDQVDQTARKPTVLDAEEERNKTAENGSMAIVLANEEDKLHPDDSDRYTSSDSESYQELEENIIDQPRLEPEPDYRAGSYAEYSDRQVPVLPLPGSGLEAMDVCESLFGYWPCLSRYERECARERARQCAADGELSCNIDWHVAADYLFGGQDPYAYGERREIGSTYANAERRDSGSTYGGSIW